MPGHYFERMPSAFSPMRSPIFLASALSSSEMSLKKAASCEGGQKIYKKWREDLRRHQLHVLPLTFWLYAIHARLLHSFFRATLAGRLKLGLWWECCPLTRAATQHYIRDWSIAQDWWQLEGPTSLGNWKDSVYQTRIVFIDCSTSHWLPSLVWGRNNWCILCPNRFLTLLPHESPSTKVHPRKRLGCHLCSKRPNNVRYPRRSSWILPQSWGLRMSPTWMEEIQGFSKLDNSNAGKWFNHLPSKWAMFIHFCATHPSVNGIFWEVPRLHFSSLASVPGGEALMKSVVHHKGMGSAARSKDGMMCGKSCTMHPNTSGWHVWASVRCPKGFCENKEYMRIHACSGR